MATKTQQLAADLASVLDASDLPTDEKIKALGVARAHLSRPNTELDVWRQERAKTGPVGGSKKVSEMRADIELLKKGPRRRK